MIVRVADPPFALVLTLLPTASYHALAPGKTASYPTSRGDAPRNTVLLALGLVFLATLTGPTLAPQKEVVIGHVWESPVMQAMMQELVVEEAGYEGSHHPGRGLIAQAPPEQAPQPDEQEGGGEEGGRDQGLRIVVMPAMSRGGR